jgi:Tol biopolymer transport system component
MTIDNENNIIIAGRTNSEDFPLKGTSYGTFAQGKFNIIVTKLKPDGSELVYSTLVGGTDDDWSFDIASDENRDVYITGATKSGDFPVSKNAFDNSYNGGDDAILFKLNSNGTEIMYSTYLGGSLKDGGRGVVVDQKGRACLTGCTRSIDFPVTDNAYDKIFNGAGRDEWAWGDPFLLVMNPEGTDIEYGTYIGGSNDEEAYGIAIDKAGNIYLCGVTSSSNYPTTPGAYSRTLRGKCNIYVTKFSFSTLDYFAQTPPQDVPQKFIVYPSGSYPKLHSCPTFSPSGDEAFWATWPDLSNYTQTIYYRKKENDQWSNPTIAFFSGGIYSDKLPCFSRDGKRVYFTSDRPLTGSGNPIDENVWYIERNAAGWSDPICLDNSVNTSQHESWITVAANNNLYFCRNNKLYLATWQNDHYLPAQSLPIYNSASGVLGTIAPDESYYIVQSEYVKDSSDSWIDDLYILMKTNGVWGTPVKLDSKINSMKSKSFAKISPDGKYLFFLGDNDAYWVSTDFTQSLTGVEKTYNSELP